jgi:Spy/CpxP family protein refolding chaperone
MENRNMTILKWCVGILVILNIVLLVNSWRKPGVMHPPPNPPRHADGGGPAKMIIEELKFTTDQIKQFEKLKEEHQQAIRELHDKGREIRHSYFELLKQDEVDQSSADELSVEIANNQKEIEKVTFEHFKAVRKICTAEQKKHFDEIIGDVLRHMAGNGRGPMPPTHPHGPEGPPMPSGDGPPHPQHPPQPH